MALRRKGGVNEFMKKKGEEGKLRSNFLVLCCERFYGLLVFIRGNWRTFFGDLKLLCNGEYVREIFRHERT